MCDPLYMERILTLILNIMVSEELDFSCVPLDTCQRELEEHDDVPSYMIKHVLKSFAISIDGERMSAHSNSERQGG